MDPLAGARMILPPLDSPGRSFALLDEAVRERLGRVLLPLPWIDGLITATMIAPDDGGALEEALDWLDYIWSEENEADLGNLTPVQTAEATALVMDHYCHVASQLLGAPDAYRPYLGGFSDPLEAAAEWASGFCGGIALAREVWAALGADEEVTSLLAAIFCLVREEDLPEDAQADLFRDLPEDKRAELRRETVEKLPEIVLALNEHAVNLGEDLDLDDDLDVEEDLDSEEVDQVRSQESHEPYIRPGPKVGRNDPCPCGSGNKYKKCCLGRE